MEFDAILYFEDSVNESTEHIGTFMGLDPNSEFGFGSRVRSGLSGLGRGYNVTVTDFGTDVYVGVTYTNVETGKTAGANFLIKFANKEGKGLVKCSAVRWRSITDSGQAVSYISSRCTSLQSATGGQMS